MNPVIFEKIDLDATHQMYISTTVTSFQVDSKTFDKIWQSHPAEYHTLKIHGRDVKTPRWQQAYGKNYRYTGSMNNALPIPNHLSLFLEWAKTNIDERLNGLLLNWYDGQKNHYIGAHRDDTRDLYSDSPVVTISLGQERVFRMRPWKQRGFKGLTIRHGDVVVVPWDTNLKWTHEVPHFKKYEGRRISVTLRAYKGE